MQYERRDTSDERRNMDELDSRIFNALQNDFPIARRPYHLIAEKLQISCDRLFDRVQKLNADGVIRRIGAGINSREFGFSSTLAAISIDPENVQKASETIAKFHEVTHSYLRNDKFNVWFTIIAPSNERTEQILGQIRTELSLQPNRILNLPMKRLFKLDTKFKIP